tara:strand:+ start:5109 stop:5450 length:342 start_codon:yes stop_codon:yes gene_type:complete
MQWYTQEIRGIEFSEDVMACLGLQQEYSLLQEEQNWDHFFETFGEKYGAYPSGVSDFEISEISEVIGFDIQREYLIFDESAYYEVGEEGWKSFIEELDSLGVDMIDGSWDELG